MKHMIIVMVFISGLIFSAEGYCNELSQQSFVGSKKCSLCHKTSKQGEQYPIWQNSNHAHAYEVLASSSAVAVADTLGIDDPQKSGKCLKCHSTAYGFSEEKITDDISVEEGVSCESCHGAGKGYISLKVMKDREKAIEMGLKIPDEQTCRKCHNDTAPNAKEFYFDESWGKIKHSIPR